MHVGVPMTLTEARCARDRKLDEISMLLRPYKDVDEVDEILDSFARTPDHRSLLAEFDDGLPHRLMAEVRIAERMCRQVAHIERAEYQKAMRA